MTSRLPQPALARRSMPVVPWSGRPFGRLFREARHPSRAHWRDDPRPLRWRRLLLLVLVLLGAWVGTRAMAEILPEHGGALAEKGLLVLFGVLFAWISAGFWTGVMGAGVLLFGRSRSPLARGLAGEPVRPLDPAARTAIVMPICNEHVATVFGGLAATIESLGATGESANFDVFVLSDTSDPDIRAAEQAAWHDLAEALRAQRGGDDAPALAVHYRWRQRRTKRKAGNVADFCRRWGGAYRYFIVLDADSVMTGECLTTLVRLMEAHPDAGIIQTAPKAVGHETLHARIQQFGARAYGPLFTAGMRFWQLGESHYWGHNAILRTEPFIAHCGLPALPGRGPLGGEIMSHDFVEAALMRRAGWKVWVADELDGSYEQVPPNLVAELQRDRRWCQGNLQNSRLMFEPGLHAVHRTAFLTGALAYLSSPLWLAFLVLSTLLFAQHAGNEPVYFVEPYQLFPIWPTANVKLMLTLFGLTGVLLLAPKALSLVVIVARGEARRFGGAARLLGSALIEFVHSVLLAPVRMLFHTQFVAAALTGWRLDWKSPPRDDASTRWSQALRRHGVHAVLAVGWIAAIVVSSETFAWWLSPILAGLLLAVPLSVLSSRTTLGRAFARRRLLWTPEEDWPPRVLREARQTTARIAASPPVGFAAAVVDAEAHRRVTAALPARRRSGWVGETAAWSADLADGGPGVDPDGRARESAKVQGAERRIEAALRDGPRGVAGADRLRLLSDAAALRRLHAEVAAHRAHPDWWLAKKADDDEAAAAARSSAGDEPVAVADAAPASARGLAAATH